MAIELSREARKEAIASIERYFQENMEEKIGNIAAAGLLGFFLEEIGPSVYNTAVADVQERLLARVQDLDFEVHEDEFVYWRKYEKKRRS
jgi:uncharacterized protein (DUF2164 family)